MRLTDKLLGFLNRVFSKDPESFLAFRLRYDGQMTWTVLDGIFTTTVSGGTGVALSVSLASHTLGSLATFLSSQPGYSVPYADSTVASRSAWVLIDQTRAGHQ